MSERLCRRCLSSYAHDLDHCPHCDGISDQTAAAIQKANAAVIAYASADRLAKQQAEEWNKKWEADAPKRQAEIADACRKITQDYAERWHAQQLDGVPAFDELRKDEQNIVFLGGANDTR